MIHGLSSRAHKKAPLACKGSLVCQRTIVLLFFAGFPRLAQGRTPLVRPMSSHKFSQCSVGADAHIGPSGSYEFAADFRKNGAICRADVGIGPYNRMRRYL